MNDILKLLKFLKEKGIKQSVFAKLIGTSRATLMGWKYNKSGIDKKFMPKIIEVLKDEYNKEIDYEWFFREGEDV